MELEPIDHVIREVARLKKHVEGGGWIVWSFARDEYIECLQRMHHALGCDRRIRVQEFERQTQMMLREHCDEMDDILDELYCALDWPENGPNARTAVWEQFVSIHLAQRPAPTYTHPVIPKSNKSWMYN